MDDKAKLKMAQEAAAEAEEKMLAILLGFTPVQDMRVSDVQYIAREAKRLAFEATEDFRL